MQLQYFLYESISWLHQNFTHFAQFSITFFEIMCGAGQWSKDCWRTHNFVNNPTKKKDR